MEQQVTTADRLYVGEILKLAEERLNMNITDLAPDSSHLDAELATVMQQEEAKKRELFNKGKEVLAKFGLA